MRVLFFSIFLVVALQSAAFAKEIIGYTSKSNTWLLGSDKSDINLDEFAEVATDVPNWEMYVDLARTVQFNGENTKVSVLLFFAYDELAGICIGVPTEERSFSQLKKYYVSRYDENKMITDYPHHKSWVDEDMNVLMVARSEETNISDQTESTVIYLTDYAFGELTGVYIPHWMYEYLDSV